MQSPQSAPLAPQATPSVPVWQLPPVAAEQQPPLHGVFMSHADPHVCVVVLHAWFAAQSLALVQPQTLVPVMSRHAEPALLPAQLPQLACPSAHAVDVVPGAHMPPSQQPPLHGCVALHAVVQVPLVVSHDCPPGQSLGPAQLAATPPPSPTLPPPRSPTPASAAAAIASVMVSQLLASVRAALIAEPSARPPPSAVTLTLTSCPAGYVEKSSSSVPCVSVDDGSVTSSGAVATPSIDTEYSIVSVPLGSSTLSSTVPALHARIL